MRNLRSEYRNTVRIVFRHLTDLFIVLSFIKT